MKTRTLALVLCAAYLPLTSIGAVAQEGFYSQRLAFHSVLNLGSYVRLFGEVYHGLLSKEEREFTEDDDLDLHQGFLEVNVPIGEARRMDMVSSWNGAVS